MYKSPVMEHILNKINPIHNVVSYFFTIHLNVILFSTLNSPKPSYFLQIFITQHYIISRLFHTCCMHTDFVTTVVISDDYQLQSPQFSVFSCFCPFLFLCLSYSLMPILTPASVPKHLHCIFFLGGGEWREVKFYRCTRKKQKFWCIRFNVHVCMSATRRQKIVN